MSDDSNETLMHGVARRVKELRTRKGWSHDQLAQEMKAVGIPWERQVVTKFENGRRQTITFEELHALAFVLGVSPIQLMFPLERGETVNVLPGRKVDARQAAWWFTGEVTFPMPEVEYEERYGRGNQDPVTGIYQWYEDPHTTGAAPIVLLNKHADLVWRWRLAETEAIRWARFKNLEEIDSGWLSWQRGNIERDLESTRDEMRRRGMTPPKLADDLRHIEDKQ